jgi:hypothetical protein
MPPHKRHHPKKNVCDCSSGYLRICFRANKITALEQALTSIGVDLVMVVNAHESAELDKDVMLATINEDSGFLSELFNDN